MKRMIKRYRAEDASGQEVIFRMEMTPGPAFMGGNAALVLVEKNGEYLKMVDVSKDDWALDDFGAWCTEYIQRALKCRVKGEAAAEDCAPANRLRVYARLDDI